MKLLIIRFSSIGDIVLTTPVIRLAHTQLGAEVHFLTKQRFASIVRYNPYLSKIHTLEGDLPALLRMLKRERFDYIIDLHHNWRTFRVKRALQRPAFSFFKANIEKWLMVRFKIDRLPRRHIVERYLDTLQSFGIRNDGKGLDFFLGEEPFPILDELPGPFVCVALGAAHNTKQIPLAKLCELVKTKTCNYVLIGGKDVVETGKKLSEEGDHISDLTGSLTLEDSARVIEKSAGMITGDTGMMHIGAALKKEMIILWGNTIPAFGMYPYYGEQEVQHANLQVEISCRPCSKTGFKQCPKGHFRCMMAHDMKEVAREMDSIFNL